MSEKILSKDNWSSFVQALADARELWLPLEDGSVYKFAPCPEGGVELEGYTNSTVPPKKAVLPQTETMFRFHQGGGEITLPAEEKERILLGVRPCDARAMKLVDSVFQWEEEDPYYLERRNKILLVGLACREPSWNCFCTSLGGSPGGTEGLDVLMVDLDSCYLLRGISEEGSRLLENLGEVLHDAAEEGKQADQAVMEAEQNMVRSVDPDHIPDKLAGESAWNAPLWEEVSRACLGCGACTYLCPTCHCFDIQDEVVGWEGRRCRMWDSCMYGEYTVHASGHNPRPSRKERTRNRINHKYLYYVEKFDQIACVGCGRCITSCPVNIDILEILSRVKEEL